MRLILIGILFSLFSSGCSNAPSEQAGRAAFEARLRALTGSTAFVINSFEKTDGQQFEAEGSPAYRLFYTANVTFPNGYRPECVSDSGEFRGFNCAMASSQGRPRPLPVNASVRYSGEVIFQSTERGWIVSQVSLSESPTNTTAMLEPHSSRGADQLQPGQWEMALQLRSLEMPGAPPETVAQLRSAMSQSQPSRNCLSPEEARNPLGQMREMVAQGRAANCRFTDEVFGGGVIRIRANCPGPGGQGGGQMSMEGSFTATTLNATLTAQGSNPSMPGATMNMVAEITGRRLGECGSQ